jgi:hypothetical protein
MINFRACARCNGDVLEYFPADPTRGHFASTVVGARRKSPRTYPSRSRLTRGCVTSKTPTRGTSLAARAPRPVYEALRTARIEPNRTAYAPAALPPCVVAVP